MIAVDDREMRAVVEVLLGCSDDELQQLKPDYLRELLQRLHDLLPPRREGLRDGVRVDILRRYGGLTLAKAVRHATAIANLHRPKRKKTEAAVKRSYERLQAGRRQK